MTNTACLMKDIDLLKTVAHLKKTGADLSQELTPNGTSYLQEAARGGYFHTARFLVESGVNVNLDFNGDSPLMLATKHNHPNIMELLLEHGADMNKISYDTLLDIPETPLSVAKMDHLIEALEVLVRYGGFCTPGEMEIIRQKSTEDARIRTWRPNRSFER